MSAKRYDNLKPRKKVMPLKRQGLTQFAVSNEGETGRKLIMHINKILPSEKGERDENEG